MKKLRILLIGAGRAGMIHARNFAMRVPDAEVVAVSDVSEESAKAAAAELDAKEWYTDYREALRSSDANAVVVVTPTKYHRNIVIDAANAKKHILCEKPMAMTVEECREMIEAVEKNDVKLQIGFMRRFDENFIRAKEIIDSGAIGKVVSVKSLTHGPSTPHEWMYDIEKSNGPLAEVSSHDIDTIRWLTGSDAESVYALAGNYRCEDAREKYPDFYDSVFMMVRLKNGMMGLVDGAQGVQYGYDAQVEIIGEKGKVSIGGLQDKTTVTYTKDNGKVSDVIKSWMNLFRDAYLKEDMHFADCVLNGTRPAVTGYDGMMAVSMVKAGNTSIKTGAPVVMKEDGTC